MTPDYRYLARVLRVIDADTLHVDLDLGCDTHQRMTLRLAGINAPEMSTAEGRAATEYVRALLPVGTVVVVPPLNAVLVDLGYAVASG